MKKALMIIAIIGIIIIAGSMLYYFVFYIPSLNQEKLALQKQQYDLEQKEKQENKTALDECLKTAEAWKDAEVTRLKALRKEQGNSFTKDDMDFIWKEYQDMIDNCHQRYGE
jgi:predicted Holliday junction resolvase-like endonuclease